MKRTICIGDKSVDMVAVAALDVIYQQIFREDPLKIQIKLTEDPEAAASAIQFYNRMAFVMAKLAELPPSEMMKLGEDDYIMWLMDFERADLIGAIGEIAGLYNGEKVTSSEAKKN